MTALSTQARNPQRVNVFLDGQFAFSLSASLAAGLRVGSGLSEEALARWLDQEATETARLQALRLISRRPRSERELRVAWDKKHVPRPIQDAALESLAASGAVDDRQFARAWVENRLAFRPRSGVAIRAELRRKGVASESIRAALEGFDETQAAYEAATRVARRWDSLDATEYRERLAGYLNRRGFAWDIIHAVVERVERETETDRA